MKYIYLLKDMFLTLFSIVGASLTILKFIDLLWGDSISWHKSNYTFLIIFFIALISSIYTNFPYKKIRKKISGTEAYLTLKYGDILDSNGHIAVPSSNFFNTSFRYNI